MKAVKKLQFVLLRGERKNRSYEIMDGQVSYDNEFKFSVDQCQLGFCMTPQRTKMLTHVTFSPQTIFLKSDRFVRILILTHGFFVAGSISLKSSCEEKREN